MANLEKSFRPLSNILCKIIVINLQRISAGCFMQLILLAKRPIYCALVIMPLVLLPLSISATGPKINGYPASRSTHGLICHCPTHPAAMVLRLLSGSADLTQKEWNVCQLISLSKPLNRCGWNSALKIQTESFQVNLIFTWVSRLRHNRRFIVQTYTKEN